MLYTGWMSKLASVFSPYDLETYSRTSMFCTLVTYIYDSDARVTGVDRSESWQVATGNEASLWISSGV